MLTYGSVCSGIEAASVAWEPLGFKPKWFSEIEPFPSAVLNHHWPSVTNLGDMTKIASRIQSGDVEAPDVLVGGTPCQAFSVAGARKGLADERGQLTISYGELADAIDDIRIAGGKHPAIIVWENVPGVLSSKDNAFGAFLGLLSGEECELVPSGSKWTNAGYVHGPKRAIAWRVLDAQYFGVAQRRRRVFVVASARTDFNPAAVLFEFDGLRRDTAPSREKGKEAATASGAGFKVGSHWDGTGYAHPTLSQSHNTGGIGSSNQELFSQRGAGLVPASCDQNDGLDFLGEMFLVQQVAGTLQANGKAAGSATQQDAESGLLVIHGTQDPDTNTELAHTLGRNHGQENAIFAFAENSRQGVRFEGGDGQVTGSLSGGGGKVGQGYPAAMIGTAVRRLTPTECERLQGFPDDHTKVPYRNNPATDGPRYKAIGNSMAVCCMSWIGQRILSQINLAIQGIQTYALEHSISDDEHCALKGEYPVEFQYDLFREYA